MQISRLDMEYLFPQVKENCKYKVIPTGSKSYGVVVLVSDLTSVANIRLQVVSIGYKGPEGKGYILHTMFDTCNIPYRLVDKYMSGDGFKVSDIGGNDPIYLIQLSGTDFNIKVNCVKREATYVPKHSRAGKPIGNADLKLVMLNSNITVGQVVDQLKGEGYSDSIILERLVGAIGDLAWEEQ